MLTGDNVHLAERRSHLQEIDALRIKAARIDQLEAENWKLTAELKEARQQHFNCPKADGDGVSDDASRRNDVFKEGGTTENQPVDVEEYNRVKERLINLEQEFARSAWARQHLETKIREQKATIRQWKEYRENWILRRPNKRLSHLQSGSARGSPLATAEQHRSSSAPAPPSLPENLSPLSGVSRSSFHHDLSVEPKDEEYPSNQFSERHGGERRSISHDDGVRQAGRESTDADHGNVTQGTPELEAQVEPIKTEPATNGSSPIIVYERSLKRRRPAKAGVKDIHAQEDGQRNFGAGLGTISSKDEQISSPIQPRPLIHLDEPHDSLDLDEVGGHLDTPRKRQRMAQKRLKSSLIAASAVSSEVEMPDGMATDADFRYLDAEQLQIEGKQDEQTNTSTEDYGKLPSKTRLDEKKARRDERIARQHAHNKRVLQRLEATELSIYDPPRSSSPTTDDSNKNIQTPNEPVENRQWIPSLASPVILRPRNVNASVLPRTSDAIANRKRPLPPSRRDRGAAYVPALAEDGEGLPPGSKAAKTGRKAKDDQNHPSDKSSRATPTLDRLGALLTKPSPEKSLLTVEAPVVAVSSDDQVQSKTPVVRFAHQNRSGVPETPRSLPAKRSEPKHGSGGELGTADFQPIDATIDRYSKSAQAVSRRTKNPASVDRPSAKDYLEVRPEHEPLRARPVHRLELQDFRLNPAHSDYAYHETVRKHDEKKSLSGCTDRHCQRCKGLRQYVLDSGYKTAPKPGETSPDADARLLRDFLGDDNHAQQLKTLSAKQRSDLLIDAQVKEFANRFGCHRQAFSRSREPPGFWDLDFPTTQKAMENRAQADLMEREKVKERYWEAMRGNGKWKFADE